MQGPQYEGAGLYRGCSNMQGPQYEGAGLYRGCSNMQGPQYEGAGLYRGCSNMHGPHYEGAGLYRGYFIILYLQGPHHMCCWSSPNRALHLRELGSGDSGATLVDSV